MRILVTGKNGQVGHELMRALAPRGEVTALGRDDLDLCSADSIRAAVRGARPELIVNAAAYTAVDQAEKESELARAINADAVAILAAEARSISAALVHYSTDYVFDGAKTEPYNEQDAPNPLGIYGATKLAGERAIAASGTSYLVLRTSWVYATRGRNFLLTILRLAAEREQLRIVDDQRGAPTSAAAIADATAKVIAAWQSRPQLSGIYHLSAAGQTTWYEFARAILAEPAARALQPRPIIAREIVPIRTQEYPTPARRPRYSVLDNTKLAQTFGVILPDWRTQLHDALRVK